MKESRHCLIYLWRKQYVWTAFAHKTSNNFYHFLGSRKECLRSVIGIVEIASEQIEARLTYALYINLRFSNTARGFNDFRGGILSGNLMRHVFYLCDTSRISKHG